MKNFSGKTVGDIYEARQGDILFPAYPIYSEDEVRNHAHDPLIYRYSQGVLNQNAQASRVLPMGGGEQTIVLPSTAKNEMFQDYCREVYGEEHTGDFSNIRYYDGIYGYQELIRESLSKEKSGKVISLHPFLNHHIDASSFYIDPNIVAHLNNKENLAELTSAVPKRVLSPLHTLEASIQEYQMQFPLYLKDGTGTGGDTVRRIEKMADIERAKVFFAGLSLQEIIIEEGFEYDENYNVQFVVNSQGESSLVHYSEQRTTTAGEYLGNIIDLRAQNTLPEVVQNIVKEIASSAHKMGWYGIGGMDILYHRSSDTACLIDPNFRLNGSTTAKMTRDVVASQADGDLMMNTGLYPRWNQSIEQSMSEMRKWLESGEIFLFGAASAAEDAPKYSAKFYAGITGSDTDALEKVKEELSRQFLIS